jgi:oxygen-independent coproporphyrinogen-3 oxidase
MSKKPVGLYIHVPFCVTKCNYCTFYSEKYTKNKADSWKSAIVHTIAKYEQTYDTIFFGGGTPSLLWREIVQLIPLIPAVSDAEITVEMNPDDINREMLSALLNAGVNRISIGVQSLDNAVLKSLNRRHNAACAVRAVELAYTAGLSFCADKPPGISADLMLGIRGQSAKDIDDFVKMPLTHISAYIFENAQTLPEDEIADMYLYAVKMFEANGFPQYEISNFGQPCRHNLKYWNCEEYIGIGATAHSYYNGKRFAEDKNRQIYITEDNPGSYDERVMLALRLTKGVELTEALRARAKLIPEEYIKIENNRLFLTNKGFLVSNRIIGQLLGNY